MSYPSFLCNEYCIYEIWHTVVPFHTGHIFDFHINESLAVKKVMGE